jgi:formylglycine-generating enzyme
MTTHRSTWLDRAAASVAVFLLFANGARAGAGDRVSVGSFAIDATEVTIAQFREFAGATGFKTEAERRGGGFEYGAGWERRHGWTVYRPFGRDPASPNEPAVHVTWHEANSYCRWRGGRLPTAEEWKRAAYTERRAAPPAPFERDRTYRYPVGDSPQGANTRGSGDRWEKHAPAGETKPGVNGLFDMGGNVWEWVSDARNAERRTMGGSWWYGPDQMAADVVAYKPADFYAVYVGFRCAYDRPK